MRKRDLRSNIKVQPALYGAISTDTTTNGNWIDTKGYDGLTFVIHCGARSALVGTPLVMDSDAVAHGDAANVDDTYLVGTEAGAVVDAAGEVTTIGYAGKKRWVRLSIVSTAAGTATIAAQAILAFPQAAPVTQGVGA